MIREVIQKRAMLARDGFMTKSLSRVSTGLRVAFVKGLLPKPTIQHLQWDHGDCTNRALLAWLYLKDILGETEKSREVETGLWQHLKSIVVPTTGMVCVPEYSDVDNGKYFYHMWDQGRYFDYLVRKYQHSSTSQKQKKEVEEMISCFQNGIYSLAKSCKLDGGRIGLKWQGDAYWNDSPTLPPDRDFGPDFFRDWCIANSQLIGPETEWAVLTGNEKGIDRAIQLAHGFVAGLESPRRGSTQPTFSEKGEFKGHVHCTLSGLIGLVKLSKVLLKGKDVSLAKEWIKLAIRVYQWLFDPKQNPQSASSCGCVPEGMDLPKYSLNSEICCTADTIELAAELAELSALDSEWTYLADLWDDVERFTRNELLANQFTNISLLEKYVKDYPDQNRSQSVAILEKLVGTWVAVRTYLNDFGLYRKQDQNTQMLMEGEIKSEQYIPLLESAGCCAYSGIRGLYMPFMKAVIQKDRITQVRIPIDQNDDNMQVNQLSDHEIQFVVHRDSQLHFRKPVYASKESVSVNGSGCDVVWSEDHRWLRLNLKAGMEGAISWNPTVWSTKEIFGPPNETGIFQDKKQNGRIEFTLSYRGNILTHIKPAGKYLPYEQGV